MLFLVGGVVFEAFLTGSWVEEHDHTWLTNPLPQNEDDRLPARLYRMYMGRSREEQSH